jgi:hypothetical protein
MALSRFEVLRPALAAAVRGFAATSMSARSSSDPVPPTVPDAVEPQSNPKGGFVKASRDFFVDEFD